MATMCSPTIWVDYCLADGEVRHVEYKGRVLYDAESGIAVRRWDQIVRAWLRKTQGVESMSEYATGARGRTRSFIHRLASEGQL